MAWSDFFNGLGSLGSFIGNVAPVAFGAYNLFNQPKAPSYQPQPQFAYQPQPQFDMSGIGEWLSGLQEMMAGQQEAFAAQQKTEQQKALARSASTARKAMQGQGITWDPENPNIGAGGVDAIASQLGVPPDELLAALKGFGGQYGFEGFA